MLPRNDSDRIQITFDGHCLVANTGLIPLATLARHLGLRELVDHHLSFGGAPRRANTGDKLLTLVTSALPLQVLGQTANWPCTLQRLHSPPNSTCPPVGWSNG